MTGIRRPLTALVALFVGAVVLDRIGLSRADGRAVDTSAYLVAAALVGASLSIRSLRRARPWVPGALALGSYALVRLVGAGSAEPYGYLTEAAFVALAAVLANRIAAGLDHLDDALGSVVFGESPALPLDGPNAANEILAEMARSRRHRRPLSVTVLVPDPGTLETAVDAASEEVQRAVRAAYVHSHLARTIGGQLRRSDLLFEDPETGCFVVLSPETGSEGSQLLVSRIREAILTTRVRLTAGTASFPDHALTFEQLVEAAQQRAALDTEARPEASRVGAA